jgi:phosphatidylethanolamine/phosphatidyl-N-methylethanolamine N-methyltransferase
MQRALAKLPPKFRLDDEVRFIASWLQHPLKVGAVSPSGKALAQAIAAEIDPEIPGPIVELGPGTGPVTEALIERGIAPERLVLVEYDPDFCKLLRRRFPRQRSFRATLIRSPTRSQASSKNPSPPSLPVSR